MFSLSLSLSLSLSIFLHFSCNYPFWEFAFTGYIYFTMFNQMLRICFDSIITRQVLKGFKEFVFKGKINTYIIQNVFIQPNFRGFLEAYNLMQSSALPIQTAAAEV